MVQETNSPQGGIRTSAVKENMKGHAHQVSFAESHALEGGLNSTKTHSAAKNYMILSRLRELVAPLLTW